MDEILQDFLIETQEGLDELEGELVALESDPSDRGRLDLIFRVAHTIKGNCGFLGFERLGRVAHIGEDLLGLMRDGTVAVDEDKVGLLLEMLDALRAMSAMIEAGGGVEGDDPRTELCSRLQAAQGGAGPDKFVEGDDIELEAWPDEEEEEEAVAAAPAPEPKLTEPQAPTPAAPVSDVSKPAAPSTVRVDVGLLDRMMNLVGELVLARNEILGQASMLSEPEAASAVARLNTITTELQERVMKTRMQPIANLFSRIPRLVRDLSKSLGKQVELEVSGHDTELDRTLIEAIGDPLTHLVRNALDHGLETPDEREDCGKEATGTLSIRAYHQGGRVHLEIVDDGGGINADRVRAKALEKGLITGDEAASLTDQEAVRLLFRPGFSTAEEVSAVSGRGVGLDVVRCNIERIGGSIEVRSERWVGTEFRIELPLTLAIVPALIVRSGGQSFAIPQSALEELVRVGVSGGSAAVEWVSGAPMTRLRGRLLPVVFLHEQLHPDRARFGEGDLGDEVLNMLVLSAGRQRFGLVVDEVLDTHEIVVKPMGVQLQQLPTYAGATIMGDGTVALILDVVGVAQLSGVFREGRGEDDLIAADAAVERGPVEALLALAPGRGGGHAAVPLSAVARLEELHEAQVERAGDRELLQYRGGLLPLVRLSDWLPGCAPSGDPNSLKRLVVCTDGARTAGLVVEGGVDIIEQAIEVQRCDEQRHGVVRSVVLADRVTEVLDLAALLEAADPVADGQRSMIGLGEQ